MENKWIESDIGCIWFIVEDFGRDKQTSYGFNRRKIWCDSSIRNSEKMIKITLDIVLSLFKDECINRGLEPSQTQYLRIEGGDLYLYDQPIMVNGIWNEIPKTLNINYEIY